eukprot:COSAG01_NODE_5253_length_4382_cov_285.432407_3_plen_59_part_00
MRTTADQRIRLRSPSSGARAMRGICVMGLHWRFTSFVLSWQMAVAASKRVPHIVFFMV